MGYLIAALILAALGQVTVKLSLGFKRLLPSILSFALFGLCIYFLTLSVQYIEVGIAYAVWSGVSIAATTLLGILFFNEKITRRKLISTLLILVGVVIL
ncbi:DMT family transporter [Halobacillus halophilus]|uniref:DMT family transporter n=1 Tax=Halobacillus halophilus TaxID=1570 RepID=UPI001CD663D6|nr:SMR family transporter [Halobacillus halophilus]MCA1011561.1 QacE family quaternary ammonium compound efflux SMR transporter [Halobacillus halophilus]